MVLEGGVGLNVGFQVDIIVIVLFFFTAKKSSSEAFLCLFLRFFTGGVFWRGMRSFYCGITAGFYVGRTIVGEWTFLRNLEKKRNRINCGNGKFRYKLRILKNIRSLNKGRSFFLLNNTVKCGKEMWFYIFFKLIFPIFTLRIATLYFIKGLPL